MKKLAVVLACFFSGLVNAGAAAPNGTMAEVSSPFTVVQSTQIPGEVLKPGQYVIHVVDHLDDRFITRVDDAEGKHSLIFLSVLGSSAVSRPGTGISTWDSGPNHLPAFRGFAFSSGLNIEFVYPKEDAAQLAKLNKQDVVAVDYAASNLKSLTGVSNEEMREINLWLLSLTHTGPDDKTPAILATRYVAPYGVAVPGIQSAASPAAPAVEPPVHTAIADNAPVNAVAPSRTRVARITPQTAELPHTGSDLPLVWLAGFASLFAAFVLRAYALRENRCRV